MEWVEIRRARRRDEQRQREAEIRAEGKTEVIKPTQKRFPSRQIAHAERKTKCKAQDATASHHALALEARMPFRLTPYMPTAPLTRRRGKL
ncbi:hypothetical protein F4X88_09830 [Candidatus Poribacteria bacterium]|nr:hypothetical protein [Candidatus Poribacteria bacterium]MYA56583.1 hypothetical protein [Candidatus Poribacteria bacterium]